MKILMISAEANPYFKTGGLGDVVYSLSEKLSKNKNKVIIALPYYSLLLDKNEKSSLSKVTEFSIHMNKNDYSCEIFKLEYENITYLFFGNSYFFRREKIYGYEDDIERFSFFSNAIIEYFLITHEEFDIIHLHDWHTGMIPYLYMKKCSKLLLPKFIFTIHNPAFKGFFDKDRWMDLFGENSLPNTNFDLEKDKLYSFLRLGILFSNKITTVSPSHAKELLQENDTHGLYDILKRREHDFCGILNGIDVKEFNPNNDEYLDKTFNRESVLSNKIDNKNELCKKMNITNSEYPLYGVVSRLTSQKGIQLLIEDLPELMKKNLNIIVLGVGEPILEKKLLNLQKEYPNHLSINLEYSDELAHQIYASSDFFLMPSFYEPCGIGQMIALRYGSIPCVRETGGLIDTVIPFNGMNENEATGLSFHDFSSQALLSTILFSKKLFEKKRIFSKVIHNAMKIDNSWNNSYLKYLSIYLESLKNS